MTTRNGFSIRPTHVLGAAFVAGVLALAPAALAQRAYPTPEAAADALVDSVSRHDLDALRVVLGADYRKYVPRLNDGDVTDFLEAWAKSHKIVRAGDNKAWLGAGVNGWTLPIPIWKSAAGWAFDTRAAADEMRARRIGKNELAAIEVALAYTDAQEDYARYNRDRGGRRQYAQKVLSSPGRHDGLYWPAKPGQPESPLGSEIAHLKSGEGFHGYYYRVLTAQGKDAPGGAKSYVLDGAMTGGYGLVAWPVKWGDTGVMSFIVSKDGVVYEKNLGPGSAAAARAMTAYNPDGSWTKVKSK